jgi:hypothetical protein
MKLPFFRETSGRFFEKKLRKKLLLPKGVGTSRLKVTKVFWFFLKKNRFTAFFDFLTSMIQYSTQTSNLSRAPIPCKIG